MRIPHQLRTLIFCFAGLTVPACGLAERTAAVDSHARDSDSRDAQSRPWLLNSLDGNTIDPFTDTRTRAIVLVFIATDCPIANAYHPRLRELEREFRDQGVSFFLVHSTAGITAAAAQEHADAFDLSIPIILDAAQTLASRVDAKVTPEAIVVQRGTERAIYRGKIDNLYEGYGKKRRAANQHYLQDALHQWLAGKEIVVSATKPLGCYISYARR